MRGRRPSERHGLGRCRPDCVRFAGGATSPVGPPGFMPPPRANGWVCRFQHWSRARSSRRPRSSSRRTGTAAGNRPAASAISCRVSRCADSAVTPITASRSASAQLTVSGAPMPITAAVAATPTASVASAFARTRRCARINWMRRSGVRSSACCRIRAGSRRSTSGVWRARARPVRAIWPVLRPRLPSCAAVWGA
jgi:hypothetical protein